MSPTALAKLFYSDETERREYVLKAISYAAIVSTTPLELNRPRLMSGGPEDVLQFIEDTDDYKNSGGSTGMLMNILHPARNKILARLAPTNGIIKLWGEWDEAELIEAIIEEYTTLIMLLHT